MRRQRLRCSPSPDTCRAHSTTPAPAPSSASSPAGRCCFFCFLPLPPPPAAAPAATGCPCSLATAAMACFTALYTTTKEAPLQPSCSSLYCATRAWGAGFSTSSTWKEGGFGEAMQGTVKLSNQTPGEVQSNHCQQEHQQPGGAGCRQGQAGRTSPAASASLSAAPSVSGVSRPTATARNMRCFSREAAPPLAARCCGAAGAAGPAAGAGAAAAGGCLAGRAFLAGGAAAAVCSASSSATARPSMPSAASPSSAACCLRFFLRSSRGARFSASSTCRRAGACGGRVPSCYTPVAAPRAAGLPSCSCRKATVPDVASRSHSLLALSPAPPVRPAACR